MALSAIFLSLAADAETDAKTMSWSRLLLGRARRIEDVKHAGTSTISRGILISQPHVRISTERRRPELILRNL